MLQRVSTILITNKTVKLMCFDLISFSFVTCHRNITLGEGVNIHQLTGNDPAEEEKMKTLLEEYRVNQYISEKISLHRNIADQRNSL